MKKILLLCGCGILVFAIEAHAGIITVNTTDDNQVSADGKCTLREALQNSAQNADTTGGDCAPGQFGPAFGQPNSNDKIHFNIPGPGPHRIKLTSTLGLAFLERVDIHAETQPGAVCGTPQANFSDRTLKVILDGSLLPANTLIGVKLMNATIARPDLYKFSGFSVQNFPNTAVYFGGSKSFSSVYCNNIGIDTDNVTPRPNKVGLEIFGAPIGGMLEKRSEFNRIYNNIISGNTAQGIRVENAGKSYIHNNLIGVKANLQPAGNGAAGIDFTINDLINEPPTGTNGLWYIQDNIIAHNGAEGVILRSGRFTNLLRNKIYGNAKIGIDLVSRFPAPGQTGITPNDFGDVDGWAVFNTNHGLNYPVLNSATLNAALTTVTINYSIDDNAEFGVKRRVEFFANPQPLPAGKREGKIYLGFADIVTNNTPGAQVFTSVINIPPGVPTADINNIVATTTEKDIVFVPPAYPITPYLNVAQPPFPINTTPNPITGDAILWGSTSEFSAPVAVGAPPAGGGNQPPAPWNPVPKLGSAT